MTTTNCRFCAAPLHHVFADLGMSPVSNSYLTTEQLGQMEPFYPLCALVCDKCLLVQLDEFESPEQIFSDYAYFSSYSKSWLAHCERYVGAITERLGLGAESHVVELASNDGYLLQYFVDRGISCLGVEPAENVAEVARAAGVPTVARFFGRDTASDLAADQQADLIIGNNVLAHVPDLNDFVAGMKILLKPDGVITMEFPHLMRLYEENQYDTIYHEHFSYFSLLTVTEIFAAHELFPFDVEELPTHGGSLRLYVRHAADQSKPRTATFDELLERERAAGFGSLDLYLGYEARVEQHKRDLLAVLIEQKRAGKTVVGYGAPAKGNTMLNYCGIGKDFIDYTVDLNPHKQGMFLPGTHIAICSPDQIAETKPDIVLILPWNLRDEITEQLPYIREWGGQFLTATPQLELY